jgi:two-component system KDP operon response regulator KdpE
MPRATVLVVDDDESGRESLRDMLRHVGHEVVTAPDATTAVREATLGAFDIAFIDIHMPGHDGLETLRMLQLLMPDAHCVMMSGVQDRELEETCMRNGAETFLHKPLHLKPIGSLVDRLVGQPSKSPEDDMWASESMTRTTALLAEALNSPPRPPAAQ